MPKAVFGAGCFWGIEKKFSEIKGVLDTEVGYSQGISPQTSYEEVCSGNTNHVEVVEVTYDEKVISYESLIDFFIKYMIQRRLISKVPIKELSIVLY